MSSERRCYFAGIIQIARKSQSASAAVRLHAAICCENLKALRRQYGYTQQFVAEQLGITPQSYHAYEAGITIPTLPNFIKLARLYDVSLDDLLE